MKRTLETNFPVCESAEEIDARMFEIWDTITPEMCSNYCANYGKRLLAVIEANGGYPKYYYTFFGLFFLVTFTRPA
jgi:hypothetical protein